MCQFYLFLGSFPCTNHYRLQHGLYAVTYYLYGVLSRRHVRKEEIKAKLVEVCLVMIFWDRMEISPYPYIYKPLSLKESSRTCSPQCTISAAVDR